jgi:hypothetical protein
MTIEPVPERQSTVDRVDRMSNFQKQTTMSRTVLSHCGEEGKVRYLGNHDAETRLYQVFVSVAVF